VNVDRRVEDLFAEIRTEGLTRRDVIVRATALGLSGTLLASLLAACGEDDDEVDAPDVRATDDDAEDAPVDDDTEDDAAPEPADDAEDTDDDASAPDGAAFDEPIILAMGSEPKSMDSHLQTDNEETNALYHIYDPLVNRTPDGDLVPGLIEDWEAQDDENRIWHLRLRQGVEFHNGEPWTAEVLKFNLERIRDYEEAGVRQYIQGIDRYDVIDDHTMEIEIGIPLSLIQNGLLQVGMVPMEHTLEVGDAGLGEDPVGTGPFKFIEWRRDEHIALEAYEDYWGGAPSVKQGSIRVIPEGSSRVAALVSDEIQLSRGISVFDVDRIEASDIAQVIVRPGPRMYHLKMDTFNETGSPGILDRDDNPFVHREVRQAIYHAINIDELISSVLRGYADPANQGVAPFIWGHNPDVSRYEFDPDRARELLAEAGYEDGFSVRFDVQSEMDTVGEAIAGYLGDIGIDVELNAVTTSVFRDINANREITLAIGSWGSTMVNTWFDGNVHTVDDELGLGRSNNGQYSNAEVDEMIDDARATFDPDEQLAKYQEIQRVVFEEEVAVVPLYHESILVGARSDIDVVARFNEHLYLQDASPR
jgi:peptide/nickel transport system substrate-binding protein